MEQVLTLKCKLQVDATAAAQLDETLQAFADACNFINQNAPTQLTNARRMQALLYPQVRQSFGLSANLAIRALARVSANRKAAQSQGRQVQEYRPTSADYDARIFSFREQDWTVSLTLRHGRQRFSLAIGPYQYGLLQGQHPTSATLVKHGNGDYYVHFQLKFPIPELMSAELVIGVDLGRRDIAHTSEGGSFSGDSIKRLRDQFAKVRASAQHKASKGTRSMRRRCRELLRRLSGRERRFQSWLNHTISYRIVSQAQRLECGLALEDLTGIRERTNEQPRNRTERRRANSWAFYQLRQFLTYKAARFGVPLVLVNAAYTSQTCHRCLHLGKRTDKSFNCGHCGYDGDADYNAAKNIALLGAVVNQPDGPGLFCSLSSSPRALESSLQTA